MLRTCSGRLYRDSSVRLTRSLVDPLDYIGSTSKSLGSSPYPTNCKLSCILQAYKIKDTLVSGFPPPLHLNHPTNNNAAPPRAYPPLINAFACRRLSAAARPCSCSDLSGARRPGCGEEDHGHICCPTHPRPIGALASAAGIRATHRR